MSSSYIYAVCFILASMRFCSCFVLYIKRVWKKVCLNGVFHEWVAFNWISYFFVLVKIERNSINNTQFKNKKQGVSINFLSKSCLVIYDFMLMKKRDSNLKINDICIEKSHLTHPNTWKQSSINMNKHVSFVSYREKEKPGNL